MSKNIENTDLFGQQMVFVEKSREIGQRTKSGTFVNNPMIRAYGITEGQRCKKCDHLICKTFAKRYYKCELRENVHKTSPVSDHKVNWPACGKFKPVKNANI